MKFAKLCLVALNSLILILALTPSAGLAQRKPTAEASAWKAGLAKRVVTPDSPMWMAGYASRNKPSEGKLQDLYVKALALEGPKGKRLVIVTCDLISVPRPIRDALEDAVGSQFKIPPEGLMINCSHTHCGPEIRTTRWSLDGLPAARLASAKKYVAQLQAQLVDVVGAALADLKTADVSYCRARCGFAMNRRTPSVSGFRNFPNPDGPVDHDVPVLKIKSDGKLRGVLFGYACHNTTLGIYQFNGDYAGFAQQYLEAAHPGAQAMFVAGCGGDQNPYPRRTIELAQQHGRSLANAVEAALTTNDAPLSGSLRMAYSMATVEYQTPPTRKELLERSQSSNKWVKLHAERLLEQLDDEGQLRQHYECPVQVLQIGQGLTMVALPGETVVDYSLRLKRELPAPDGSGPAIWIAGYSNDVFAYLPSRRVLLEGGYEAGGAMKYMTTVLQHGPFTPDVERRIIDKALQLNEQLKAAK